ncbi:MAG TPA: GDSL-type esterase/lipase family protein [Jatrophihabitans sp.]|jgi:lysophospholipase L1-like esterase
MLSLGDSFSCGEGVGVRLDVSRTWTGVLAAGIGAELTVLARPGATTCDVRTTQLPLALGVAPAWATLLVGLNDVFKTRFDTDRMHADLAELIGRLHSAHAGLLVARLHDPCELLPLSNRLKTIVGCKVAAVNAMIDSLAAPGIVVVDLSRLAALRRREAWAVDRLHPSPFGHTAIAAAAARGLAAAGTWPAGDVASISCGAPPTRLAECRWVVRHGVPWVARRAPMLGNAFTAMLNQ